MQWVIAEITTHSTITLPTSFSNTHYIVSTTHQGMSANATNWFTSYTKTDASKCEIYSEKTGNMTSIFAIGF